MCSVVFFRFGVNSSLPDIDVLLDEFYLHLDLLDVVFLPLLEVLEGLLDLSLEESQGFLLVLLDLI